MFSVRESDSFDIVSYGYLGETSLAVFWFPEPISYNYVDWVGLFASSPRFCPSTSRPVNQISLWDLIRSYKSKLAHSTIWAYVRLRNKVIVVPINHSAFLVQMLVSNWTARRQTTIIPWRGLWNARESNTWSYAQYRLLARAKSFGSRWTCHHTVKKYSGGWVQWLDTNGINCIL